MQTCIITGILGHNAYADWSRKNVQIDIQRQPLLTFRREVIAFNSKASETLLVNLQTRKCGDFRFIPPPSGIEARSHERPGTAVFFRAESSPLMQEFQ